MARDFEDVDREDGGEAVRAALAGATKVYDLVVQVPVIDPALDFTQRYAAEVWVGRNKSRWRYDHTVGAWYEFVGSHWERDEVRAAFNSIAEMSKRRAESASFIRGAEAFA